MNLLEMFHGQLKIIRSNFMIMVFMLIVNLLIHLPRAKSPMKQAQNHIFVFNESPSV